MPICNWRVAWERGSKIAWLRQVHQLTSDVDRGVDWTDQLSKLQSAKPTRLPVRLAKLLSAAIPEGQGRKLYGVFLRDESPEGFSQST